MEVSEKVKPLTPQERQALLPTWDGVKGRHQGIDITVEWNKYKSWRIKRKMGEPKPTIKAILEFEKIWLKSNAVARFRNPDSFKEKEKEISLADIQKVCDLLSKRRMQVTEDEVKKLLLDGVSVLSVEMWFKTAIMPKNLAFKYFMSSKGRH